MIIRPATPNDIPTIRSQWRSRESPSKGDSTAGMVPFGRQRHSLSIRNACRALTMLIDALLEECTVLVAELPSVPGELLGWVAYDGSTIHYVCVPSGYGRRGIARRLVESAGTGLKRGWMTPNGRRFLDRLDNPPA